MGLDSTSSDIVFKQSVAVGGGSKEAPPPLRLVAPSLPSPRQSGFGKLGNMFLEMPWPIWATFDAVIVAAGVYFGYRMFVWSEEASWVRFGLWQTITIQCMTLVFVGMVFGLYEQQTLLRRSRILARSLLSIVVSVLLTYMVIYLFMYQLHSRRVLFLAASLYFISAPAIRLLICGWLSDYSRNFLIVGTDRKSRVKPAGMGDGLSKRYNLVGYVTMDSIEVGRNINGRPVLGSISEIERICLENKVDEVVVGPVSAKTPRLLEKTLSCLRLGCRVTNLSTFYEEVLSQVPVEHLEPNWFLFADLKHYREAQLIMKRAFDIVGSVLGLILTLPFWPVIALAVKLDNRGPVFYHQQRVGMNGRIFRLHKFRTMYTWAEQNGCMWAKKDDPRVTRVGRFLRKSRLDELPQLINILLGQMAIVGPRPERPEFVCELSERIRFYNERHLIKPGLSGWAQINYPYGASIEDAARKLELDLWYLKHMSLELDLAIILRTLGTMFLGSR